MSKKNEQQSKTEKQSAKPTAKTSSAKGVKSAAPAAKKPNAKSTKSAAPTAKKPSAKSTKSAPPTTKKPSAKSTKSATPTAKKSSAESTKSAAPSEKKASAKSTKSAKPKEEKSSAKSVKTATPSEKKTSAKSTKNVKPKEEKSSAKSVKSAAPTVKKSSAKSTKSAKPAAKKLSAKSTKSATPSGKKPSAKSTKSTKPKEEKSSAKSVKDTTPKEKKSSAKSTKSAKPKEKKPSAKSIKSKAKQNTKSAKRVKEKSSDPSDRELDLYPDTAETFTRRWVKILSVCVLAVVLAAAGYFTFRFIPSGSSTSAFSPVRLNEVMSTSSSCPNTDGVFSDYIELYNDSDADVDISGFQLSDSDLAVDFIFDSDTVVSARGYLVVSCDGNKSQRGNSSLYASFSLSRDGGEEITLKNSLGITVDTVTTVGLSKNEAMIRTAGGQWTTFFVGTPGYKNNAEGRVAYIDSLRISGGLTITELMAGNLSGIADKSGERYDWIELTNTSDESIDLGGYHISDDPINLKGYALPPLTLAPGERTILFASNLAQYEDGEIHTNFSLSGDGETLWLTDPNGRIVFSLEYPSLPDNHSYMLHDGEYAISVFSSPGAPETQPVDNAYEGLTITELMPVNTAGIKDSDGDFSDWIELTNDSSKDINLSGCWLSTSPDNVFFWQLPDVTIKSGACLLLFASGKDTNHAGELHTDFRLSSDSQSLTLTSPNGYTIDTAAYESSQPNYSLVRDFGGFTSTAHSSPGFINGTDGYIAFQESLETDTALIISEAMTANDTVLAQPFGRYYDWVEIKNAGDVPLQLSDYYLSDDDDNKVMWRMPDITLAPGEYKVFLCSGDETLTDKRYTHVNFSLNISTETLYVFDDYGSLHDWILLCDIPANVSAGRMDESNGLFLFQTPTPGKQNTDGVRAVSTAPRSTMPAGLYDTESLTVPLYADGEIYYTTDGSAPSSKSKKYDGPITITDSTVVRAITYSQGSLKSAVTTMSYFLNEGNTLPIMSLSAAPADLWSNSRGIYVAKNAFKPWEKDAHIEFFDPDGDGFSIDCGLSLFGGGTRVVSAKKSFQVRFRSVHGEKSLVYNMFEDSSVNEFKSLVFRAGQDSRHTVFRDELFSSIALKESPTLLAQNYRYCLLFINGEFFGIYCIKERLGDDYYAAHYNVPIDSVEVLKGPVRKSTSIYALMSFVQKNDMRIAENYEFVASQLDFDSLIDWYIFESCSGNNDISGNVRYIRSSEGDGKWRLALFDLDFTLRWPINDFAWLYNSSNQHAIFLKGLIKNPEFKDKFLTRFGYLLDNVFTEEKLQARIDEFAQTLRGDIDRDRRRWHSNLTYDRALEKLSYVLHTYDYRGRIVRSVCRTLSLSADERAKYFGS